MFSDKVTISTFKTMEGHSVQFEGEEPMRQPLREGATSSYGAVNSTGEDARLLLVPSEEPSTPAASTGDPRILGPRRCYMTHAQYGCALLGTVLLAIAGIALVKWVCPAAGVVVCALAVVLAAMLLQYFSNFFVFRRAEPRSDVSAVTSAV